MSAIIVEGLGKRYTITHQRRHDTLRDTLAHGARNLFSRLLPSAWRGAPPDHEDFWALRDVAFKVEPGEVVGIIGRNGAGKSTLLKILSRITEPTTGRITLNGRVASLLEVGTGFHPELSGRENIFLNGAILGMRREEIRRKFDEIVAFSEVERFLDTPVKRYSSGMYVRLAFAVAAHLEPNILIVDEVLAVGDAQFQSKCLGKMRSVAREAGRTVLFVSHNLSVIQSICSRCLVLKQGRIVADGPTGDSVASYLESPAGTAWQRPEAAREGCQFQQARVEIDSADPLAPWIVIHAAVHSDRARRATLEILLHDATGQNVAIGQIGATDPLCIQVGTTTISCRFPASHLAIGRYGLSLRLIIPGVECFDELLHALAFDFLAPPPHRYIYRMVQSWGKGSVMLDLRQD
ncbi:ABC transporter ATP-binding protein [Geminisphaera colitermitum]|uniref:ABC transporter ATP-binding protein n=1 Tax=Geminisphaera colitermitum TaxID=1148786 RepID=UPI000158D26D|nr:ABC transporter ATP-binding protein [Geminisphaera colitermitum]